MFYDLSDPINFCKNVEKLLDNDGIFHVEIAYLPDIVREFSFDTFCQEHLTYYSLISFKNLIDSTNLKIIDYHRNSINGGSINLFMENENVLSDQYVLTTTITEVSAPAPGVVTYGPRMRIKDARQTFLGIWIRE